ncbi:hypothetical protein K1719_043377 [Acacia pycnantha]|nr:hypothetical protein K1719_043377 [Acacia pycnantha]
MLEVALDLPSASSLPNILILRPSVLICLMLLIMPLPIQVFNTWLEICLRLYPRGCHFHEVDLHDWNDKKCLKLLKNCYKSIPEDGKVIAMESVMCDMPQASAYAKCNFQIDVFMMAQGAAGGTLRTHQDFFNLAKAAGFKGVHFQCFVRNFWVMEFFK